MYKILILLGVMLWSVHHASSQRTPQYSQYMFNKYQFNHAYAGFDRSLSITGASRTQWATFDGAPSTQSINAHLPFYIWSGGIGFSLENDQAGALSCSSARVSYNFVYDAPVGLFSAGIRIGLVQSRINGSLLRTPDGVYEGNVIQHNDPILPARSTAGIAPTWSIAAYFIHDYFETGISISDLPEGVNSAGSLDLNKKSLINWFAEANLPLNNDIDILPSLFVKSDLVQTQAEIAAIFKYRSQYVAGLGFRGYNVNSVDAVVLYAGLRFNRKYTLTYSYDLGINGLRTFNEGTHEFVLNYNLQKLIGVGLPPKVKYNPRFL